MEFSTPNQPGRQWETVGRVSAVPVWKSEQMSRVFVAKLELEISLEEGTTQEAEHPGEFGCRKDFLLTSSCWTAAHWYWERFRGMSNDRTIAKLESLHVRN